MSKPLVIVGTGLLAEELQFYLEQERGWRIDAYAVDPEYLREGSFLGRPVLAFEEALARYPAHSHDMFVAIGHMATEARKRKYLAAKARGYTMPSFVHPSACVASNVAIGPNTLIQELVMVSPFVKLGENVVLAPQASINHHSTIGAHCFVSAAAVVCGDVRIEEACYVGAHSTIRDRITVGEGCVIGAGAVIMHDCPPRGVYRAQRTPRLRDLE